MIAVQDIGISGGAMVYKAGHLVERVTNGGYVFCGGQQIKSRVVRKTRQIY
jgi:hypothetical protein